MSEEINYTTFSDVQLKNQIFTNGARIEKYNEIIRRIEAANQKMLDELGRRIHEAALAEMWAANPGLQIAPGDLLDSSDYLRGDDFGKPLVLVVDSILPAETAFIVKTWTNPRLEFLHSINKPRYWSGVVTLGDARQMREAYLASLPEGEVNG